MLAAQRGCTLGTSLFFPVMLAETCRRAHSTGIATLTMFANPKCCEFGQTTLACFTALAKASDAKGIKRMLYAAPATGIYLSGHFPIIPPVGRF